MPWNGWKLNPLNYICYNRSVSSLAHHFISHIVSIQMKFTWNFVYVSFGHKCSRQRSVMMLISDSATILVWCGAVDRWLMRYYIIWPAKIFFSRWALSPLHRANIFLYDFTPSRVSMLNVIRTRSADVVSIKWVAASLAYTYKLNEMNVRWTPSTWKRCSVVSFTFFFHSLDLK